MASKKSQQLLSQIACDVTDGQNTTHPNSRTFVSHNANYPPITSHHFGSPYSLYFVGQCGAKVFVRGESWRA